MAKSNHTKNTSTQFIDWLAILFEGKQQPVMIPLRGISKSFCLL